MSILDLEVIKKFALTCNDGYEQGWHEGNGGNLSYRMTAEEVEACKPYFTYDRPWVDLGVQADNLKNEYFMVTGTGKFFQNVKRDPAANMCILEINDAGDGYRIVWGLVNGGGPTSEFPTHFMNHSVRVEATDGACRVIYHAHPVNIVGVLLAFGDELSNHAHDNRRLLAALELHLNRGHRERNLKRKFLCTLCTVISRFNACRIVACINGYFRMFHKRSDCFYKKNIC